jgi:hypothetical protein
VTSPYITPAIIANAPTGVPWSMIPTPGAAALAAYAEQNNMCWRSTDEMDRICNQQLRATLDVEEETGPDFRITVENSTGIAHMQASRWPILSVIGAQVSPAAAFPPSWSVLPAGKVRPRTQLISAYGSTTPGADATGPSEFAIAPGYVTAWGGRNGTLVQVAYLNGFPHAGLTATANAGAQQLAVDDVTAFLGAAPVIYDGANTEQVTVQSVTANAPLTVMGAQVPVGPGTVTLAAPLAYTHTVTPGETQVLVTSMPANLQWAGILLCAEQALEAGIEGLVISDVRGDAQSSGGSLKDLKLEAELILSSYHRAI